MKAPYCFSWLLVNIPRVVTYPKPVILPDQKCYINVLYLNGWVVHKSDITLWHRFTPQNNPCYNRITIRLACFYSGNGGTATHDHKAVAWRLESQSKFYVFLIATLNTLRHKHVNRYCFVVKSRFFEGSTAHKKRSKLKNLFRRSHI